MYKTNSFTIKGTNLFMLGFIFILSYFFLPTQVYAQPVNDSCYHYQQILLPTSFGSVSYTGHNSGATPEFPPGYSDCSPGGIFSGLGADVWYSFVSNSSNCLSITIEGLDSPEFNVLEASECGGGYEIMCQAGNNGLVTGDIQLSVGQRYFLRISGGSNSDQGHFTLTLDEINCPAVPFDCLMSDRIELTPPPSANNYYAPGTEVEICYTITDWLLIQDNWIHAIQIEHADRWDLDFLNYNPPFPCNGIGQWYWYDFWTNCEGEQFGPGFAYDSPQGQEFCQTNWSPQNNPPPGDNFGDGQNPCVPRTFCWTIRVKGCEQLETSIPNLDITITVLGDGTSGSWMNDSCDNLPDEIIDLNTGQCCMGEFVLAIIRENPISCPFEQDGNFEIVGTPDDLLYNVSVYSLDDSLLFYYPNISLPYVSPMVLDTGYYGVIISSPEATGEDWCNSGVKDVIHIQSPFETFTGLNQSCNSFDTTRLTATTWPIFPTTTYHWTGPNDFDTYEQNPPITDSGIYYLAVRIGDCIANDSIIIDLESDLPLFVEHWGDLSCDNSYLRLQATGAGADPDNYRWLNAAGIVILPTYIAGENYWAFDPILEDTDFFLIGFTDEGCSDTLLFTADYLETPELDFTASVANCEATTVEISFNLADADEIHWLDIDSTLNPRTFTDLLPGEAVGVLVQLNYNSLACEYVDSLTVYGPGLSINASDTTICPDGISVLNATPSQSYLWSTGDTTQNISVSPPPGEGIWYSISTVDFYDCEHTDSVYVKTYNLADATFTTILDELTVSCQPTQPYDAFDTYTWDFGDGTTSEEYNPTHVYETSDEYIISLTIETRCGLDVFFIELEIAVDLPSVAFIIEGESTGCVPLEIQFVNQSENADSYVWEFDGGTPATSTEENPIVIYEISGVYSVTLTAINNGGEITLTETNFIEVFSLPTGSFTTETDTLTVAFFSVTENVDTYLWDFGDDQTSTVANPIHEYESPGVYVVTLTVSNECGEMVSMDEIGVDITIPTVSFSVEGENIGCAPLEVQFINQSENADTYLWEFDGGTPATSTEENPVVVYEIPGAYSVVLTATNAGGANALGMTDFIEIYGPPTGDFIIESNMLMAIFYPAEQNANTYAWDFGDGQTSTETTPAHTYDLPGGYLVTLTLSNDCGETSFSQEVIVNMEIPSIAFSTEGDTTGCVPLEVQFINQTENADTYLWTFEGGTPATSTEINPVIVYETPGVYSVSLAASNAGGTNDLTIFSYVEVYAMPTGSFTIESDMATVSFFSVTENVDTYLWSFGDGQTSTEANPIHTYELSGIYTVSLILSNECGEIILTEEVSLLIDAVTDLNGEAFSLYLYPNPNEGKFWLAIDNNLAKTTGDITIFNALGVSIFQENIAIKQGYTRIPIEIENVPAGLYYLQLQVAGEGTLLKKFVVL